MSNELGLNGESLPAGFKPRGDDIRALKSMLRDLNNPALTGADVPKDVDPIAQVDEGSRNASAIAEQAKATASALVAINSVPTSPEAAGTRRRAVLTVPPGGEYAESAAPALEGPAEDITISAGPVKGVKLCFTGKTHIGKDHVATLAGAKIFGFADPLYAVLEYFFGTRQRDLPGAREFLQKIGQWGRGEISPAYPLSPERASFTWWIRAAAAEGELPVYVNWLDYGFNKDIWLDGCLVRLRAFISDNPTASVAITNVRFENELKRLTTSEGFTHFHVLASSASWAQRLAKDKLTLDAPALADVSEQLAKKFDAAVTRLISTQPKGARIRCVWNDIGTLPSPRLLSIENFLSEVSTLEAAQ